MAVHKCIRRLQQAGLEIDAVKGRGYRLRTPREPLSPAAIRPALSPSIRGAIADLQAFAFIDSTNNYLMQRGSQGAVSGSVCLAEYQSGGKGRRDRQWISPFGANLYLSLLWRFDSSGTDLSMLSLVAGLAAARAVHALGGTGTGIKWPNDLVYRDRKLGGILLEMAGEFAGRCYVVMGIGINVDMSSRQARQIDQPWVDMAALLGSEAPSRNRLAAATLNELVHAIQRFEIDGPADLLAQWRGYDSTRGRGIELHTSAGVVTGIARGIDDHGRLLVEVNDRCLAYSNGEISVRVK